MAPGSMLGSTRGETGRRRDRGGTEETVLREKVPGNAVFLLWVTFKQSGKGWGMGWETTLGTVQRAGRCQQLASEVLTGLEFRSGSHWHVGRLWVRGSRQDG